MIKNLSDKEIHKIHNQTNIICDYSTPTPIYASILLAIRPQYAQTIYKGTKIYEFRKKIPKLPVQTVFLYETAPVKKITGYFIIKNIEQDAPGAIQKYALYGQLTVNEFLTYFNNTKTAYAIRIKTKHQYVTPLDPFKEPNFKAPQNFTYLKRHTPLLKVFKQANVCPSCAHNLNLYFCDCARIYCKQCDLFHSAYHPHIQENYNLPPFCSNCQKKITEKPITNYDTWHDNPSNNWKRNMLFCSEACKKNMNAQIEYESLNDIRMITD
ncbi:MAG: hypothetical protein ACFFCI_00615 [Promethearchaeota archaeon]